MFNLKKLKRPFQIKCHYPAKGCIEHIEKCSTSSTVKGAYLSSFREIYISTIMNNTVKIQRKSPLFEIDWTPRFTGRFEEKDSQIYLIGSFSYKGYGKIIQQVCTIFFGLAIPIVLIIEIIMGGFNAETGLVLLGSASIIFLQYLIFNSIAQIRKRDMYFIANFLRANCRK